jgi:hypothetical protein
MLSPLRTWLGSRINYIFLESLTVTPPQPDLPMSAPRDTILSASSGNGRLQRLGFFPRRSQPNVAVLVGRQDHRHGLGVDRLSSRPDWRWSDQRSSEDLCEPEAKAIRNQPAPSLPQRT